MKTCTKCQISKPLSDFGNRTLSSDGLNYRCNPCKAEDKFIYRSKNKDKIRISDTHYKRCNKDKVNSNVANRYANKLKATPKWSNNKYIKLWYKLAQIEEKRTGRKVHVDHIVPLKGKDVCGLHCEDNMQLLFAEDNIRKNNSFV